ncbi:hypothetical protein CCUS01_16471 [Colletotrichum cuscutae]|uniref:Uncharacterized protein n=1 Tax=Colletotrichum cuscutae TaxID=1209917 RepID=A0AAI9VD53_9PEZI|nr:hypothetical protein CCUS01_16471 [Colletotrichum cuscutae]
MSLPLQVNQREKLLATGPFSSSPDDSTSARSWHPDFIPHQVRYPFRWQRASQRHHVCIQHP